MPRLTEFQRKTLCKIAKKTKMDCWFCIITDDDGSHYVYDIENRKIMSTEKGIRELLEGLDCQENVDNCDLTNEERECIIKIARTLKCDIKL